MRQRTNLGYGLKLLRWAGGHQRSHVLFCGVRECAVLCWMHWRRTNQGRFTGRYLRYHQAVTKPVVKMEPWFRPPSYPVDHSTSRLTRASRPAHTMYPVDFLSVWCGREDSVLAAPSRCQHLPTPSSATIVVTNTMPCLPLDYIWRGEFRLVTDGRLH